jgi:hypothetical protein
MVETKIVAIPQRAAWAATLHCHLRAFASKGGTNNASCCVQIAVADPHVPLFVGRSPCVPQDFQRRAWSYAVDAGAPVPVFSDLFRVIRPQNSLFDMGAAEGP